MPHPAEHEVLSVTTTVGSLDAANTLGRLILDHRLAACVQLDPAVTSLYRWQGQLHHDPEVRLMIKTVPACEAALQALLEKHHPYDVPQVLATCMRASPAYAQWVRSEVDVPSA